MNRRWLAASAMAVALALGAIGSAQEQIEPLSGGQQEIEILNPPERQTVESIDGVGEQEVAKNEVPTQTQRTASAVGKFAVAVLGLAVAIGASAASLIFL